MQKTPEVGNHNIESTNKESILNTKVGDAYLNLLKHWNEVGLSKEAYFNKYIGVSMHILKNHICTNIQNISILNSYISSYDEQVFKYYINTIKYYNLFITTYENNADILKNSNVKVILNQVASIFYSRIKEYEDLKLGNQSPVFIEKEQIVSSCIARFNQEVSYLIKSSLKDLHMDDKNTHDEINLFIHSNYLQSLYDKYNNYIEQSIAKLNQLENRPNFIMYKKLLKQEEEIVTAVVKVQASQLKKEENDTEIIEKMLHIVTEMHETIDKSMVTLSNLQKEASEMSTAYKISFKDFENQMKSLLLEEKSLVLNNTKLYQKSYEKSLEVFTHILNKTLNTSIEHSAINNTSVYFEETLRKSETIHKEFAKNLENILLNVINYSVSNSKKLSLFESESKIIEGIVDTLNIKVESIKESIETFTNELNSVYEIEDMMLPKNLISETIQMWQNQFSGTKISTEEVSAFIDTVIKNNYDFINGWFNKAQTNRILFIEKEELEYKKNYLLFEISTFEELLNHSISRLKASKELDIILYVQVVEEANSQINILLLNNDIVPIKPMPHEMFNGKEHEVIIAEKQEGFKKGEIIKVSNSGYKQNNKVILRANVIAAK